MEMIQMYLFRFLMLLLGKTWKKEQSGILEFFPTLISYSYS